jgi:crotonobetainyl-CoA:carnitine CoA-transferase CaiB-like acyl-CoA transferase
MSRRLRVLDLGWIWAGPLVGSVLAELGADVVKVESAGRFDPYRMRGVERRKDLGELRKEASPSFHKLNKGKRGITLNLRADGGRELLLRMVAEADVLIENFRAGTLERLGLGWDRLREANPHLVAVSLSAGGQAGRWRNLRAYALITSALAGYESLIGYPGEPPIGGSTFGAADPSVAAFGVLGTFAAVADAQRTGRGSYLDLSGVECMMGVLGPALLAAQTDSAGVPCADLTAPCTDDDTWLTTVVSDQAGIDRLAAAVGAGSGVPAWEQVRRDPAARERLRLVLSGWSSTRRSADAVAELRAAGVPAVPVLTIEAATTTPAMTRDQVTVTHPVTGVATYLGSPWGRRASPGPAPLLGANTAEVLDEWLGLGADEIAALTEQGVLA